MLGLETALALSLELVAGGVISLQRMVELLTSSPARLFRLGPDGVGSLRPGGVADVVVIDPDRAWKVDRDKTVSRSRNTPFHGRDVKGLAALTICGGKVLHDLDGLAE
jgi:dihydroorotase